MKLGSTLLDGAGGALSSSPWHAVSAIDAAITMPTVRIGDAMRDAGQSLIVEVIFAVSVIF
ncbi:hypothetical protein [Paraburkholderia ginsengisoli]|nr:hypothetical protein [Paraburkholderia ginsengisoli]